MEPVFVMLHTEFLLHWGLLYSFFWSLDVGWMWLYNYQKVWGICRGWEGCIKMKIPFSLLMKVFCSNSSIFCRVYCWREALFNCSQHWIQMYLIFLRKCQFIARMCGVCASCKSCAFQDWAAGITPVHTGWLAFRYKVQVLKQPGKLHQFLLPGSFGWPQGKGAAFPFYTGHCMHKMLITHLFLVWEPDTA